MNLKKLADIQPVEGFSQVESALFRLNNLEINSREEYEKLFPDIVHPIRTFSEFFLKMPRLNMEQQFTEKIMMLDRSSSIIIFGDYDVDGICATTIMVVGLRYLGFTNVSFYIPNRLTDGYGMNKDKVDEILTENRYDLIITVDNGISCNDAIDVAQSHGVDVIVTDHHIPTEGQIPTNCLIIDPIYNNDKFSGICGAYVAFKLIYPLLERYEQTMGGVLATLACLAGIATIKDMMPMFEENRYLIKLLLDRLNYLKLYKEIYPTDPILMLIQKLGGESFLKYNNILATEELIEFFVGPSINAISRVVGDVNEFTGEIIDSILLGTPIDDSYSEVNTERKARTKELLDECKDALESLNGDDPLFVYLYDEVTHEYPLKGIYGLIANNISDKRGVVALIGSKTNNTYSFSARGISGYSLHDGWERVKSAHPELIIGGGGHDSAMGISLIGNEVALKTFIDALREDIKEHRVENTEDSVIFEYEPSLQDSIDETLEMYAPYGNGFRPLKFFYSGIFKGYEHVNATIGDYVFRVYSRGEDMTKYIGKEYDVVFSLSFSDPRSIIFQGE